MARAKKKGLGKGLGALIGPSAGLDEASSGVLEGTRVLYLDPRGIGPNPKQPRVKFDQETLEELAESIKREGVLEPVIVRKGPGGYQLVSGERRVRACVLADLDTVPAICRDVSDGEMLKHGLIENIQREDLNPIELAKAYEHLIGEFKWTQEQLASEVGKKRVTVANTLRLLNLAPEVQAYVRGGTLSMGHAKALLAIEAPELQRGAALRVVTEGLSVRQTEKLAASPKPKVPKEPEKKDPNVARLEDELRQRLGTKVTLRTMKKQRGKIEIEYYDYDDLERILDVLRVRV